ncbi:MAG: HprK-related kinase B, partial [Gammaproteobacteria bacterium]|nr:HprK-related kinase B [Gammaproteobacteria bacterium]
FLQSAGRRMAAGPCLANDSQVINFINSQQMNWLQQRGHLICHAAGLVQQGRALAIAGCSGGGKSTLMLKLLAEADADCRFLSNDRLFIRPLSAKVEAVGVAKMPRINPGTLLGNPRLHSLVSAEQLSQWQALDEAVLWPLEQKHDVPIRAVFGPGRVCLQAPLAAFIVLNWQRGAEQPTALAEVDLTRRPDLLSAIMKPPGPFYQYADGRFLGHTRALDPTAYLRCLAQVPVYEAKGRLDFAALMPLALEVLRQ